MRVHQWFFVCGVLAVLLPLGARAESNKERLAELVTQLQQGPDSLELRKKIIETAALLAKKPEMPEEVDELMGKAKAMVKNVKSPEDFKQAGAVLHQASLLAPWDGDLYYNCGVVWEKANIPSTALNDFNLYLLAKPHAKDRKKVKERIGALEYAAQKSVDEAGSAAALQKLAGTWYAHFCGMGTDTEKYNGGCNDADCRGNNWWPLSPTAGQPWPITFTFTADGKVKLDGYASWALVNNIGFVGDIYGIPAGSALSGIRWVVHKADGQEVQIYSALAEDASYLTLSGDRPLAPSAYNPNTKYHYVFYRRTP